MEAKQIKELKTRITTEMEQESDVWVDKIALLVNEVNEDLERQAVPALW